jgi:hypothetical protein
MGSSEASSRRDNPNRDQLWHEFEAVCQAFEATRQVPHVDIDAATGRHVVGRSPSPDSSRIVDT